MASSPIQSSKRGRYIPDCAAAGTTTTTTTRVLGRRVSFGVDRLAQAAFAALEAMRGLVSWVAHCTYNCVRWEEKAWESNSPALAALLDGAAEADAG
jgi:hypothetical protein